MVYDVLVVCILLFFLAKGAARGLVWQLAGIAGILLCVTFAGTASKVIGPHIKLDPPANQWAVMFITYLLASFVAFGFARTLNGWIEKMELKEYNRHLGAVFGLIKGALLVLIMTFMIVTFSQKTRDMLKDSKAAHIAAKAIQQIEPIIPDKLHEAVSKYIRMFEATGFVQEEAIAEGDEVLPEDVGYDGESAPLDEGTSLGHSEPFDPFGMLSGSKPVKPRTPSAVTEPEEISPDLLTELRKTVGSKVSRLIADELQTATPKAKARLVQNITDALQSADPRAKNQLIERLADEGQSGGLVGLMNDWASDTLNSEALPVSRPTTPVPTRNTTSRPNAPATRQPVTAAPEPRGTLSLLDQIVATTSEFPSVQKKIKAGYNETLKMLPPEVSAAVIEDWHGDLTNSGTDTDQGTTSETALYTRIIRQLSVAQHPESQLPAALQAKLKQFRMTAEGTGVLR